MNTVSHILKKANCSTIISIAGVQNVSEKYYKMQKCQTNSVKIPVGAFPIIPMPVQSKIYGTNMFLFLTKMKSNNHCSFSLAMTL